MTAQTEQGKALPHLPDQLAAYREAGAYSQAELARRSGVSRSRLSEAESGKAGLSIPSLVAVAAALEVDPAVLMTEPTRIRYRRQVADGTFTPRAKPKTARRRRKAQP